MSLPVKRNSEIDNRLIMNRKKHGTIHGIELKKHLGQHFLRDQSIVDKMISSVEFNSDISVFEVGPGDGFLTRSILRMPFQRLWVFEIDHSWAHFIKETYEDKRMTVFEEDILKVDFSRFESYKPWLLLANLPYQVTFPLLFKLIKYRNLLKEAVVMVQEEVAQKIIKTSGRGYGFNSLYLQFYFDWKLMQKISPCAFYPPPKVYSRLLYFKPRLEIPIIENETEFWKFIKRSFSQPRRTLKNNLRSFHYNLTKLSDSTLKLRAQQLSFDDFLNIWKTIQD